MIPSYSYRIRCLDNCVFVSVTQILHQHQPLHTNFVLHRFFRKLPIQEFHFNRILQDIGLTNEQVHLLTNFEKYAEHIIKIIIVIFHMSYSHALTLVFPSS